MSDEGAAPEGGEPEGERGERIAKWLARAGVASRRDAERLIEAGANPDKTDNASGRKASVAPMSSRLMSLMLATSSTTASACFNRGSGARFAPIHFLPGRPFSIA